MSSLVEDVSEYWESYEGGRCQLGLGPITSVTAVTRDWSRRWRGVSQANMDMDILQGKKVTDGTYTGGSDGYSVVATDAPSRHRDGVAVFHWLVPNFALEAIQQFGPNIIGFQLATGERRWYIVGCYVAPDNTSTIDTVVAALKEFPRGTELLVAGDFNVNLSDPEGDRRGENIMAAMATEGLEDMLAHFLLCQHS